MDGDVAASRCEIESQDEEDGKGCLTPAAHS
jgi:hypothetical protein